MHRRHTCCFAISESPRMNVGKPKCPREIGQVDHTDQTMIVYRSDLRKGQVRRVCGTALFLNTVIIAT